MSSILINLDELTTTLLQEGLDSTEISQNSTLNLSDFRKLFQGHQHLLDNLSTM